MAPAASTHQQVALLGLSDGQLAVVIYRFTAPADRLSRGFFDPGNSRNLSVVPIAGCPAHLRDLIFLRTVDAKTGAILTRLTLARLPGVRPEAISSHLDDSLACYLATPSSGVGGTQ